MRYDNIRPASPAMTRALVMINRAFANPWGKERSMAKTMLNLGPRHEAVRARYGDIAATMARQKLSLTDAIQHLRFARKLEPTNYNRARYLESLIMLRWMRRHYPNRYYSTRDAIIGTATIMPRSW
jgi:hypothetical protein